MGWFTAMAELARKQAASNLFLHEGALFNLLACAHVNLGENDKIEIEFIGGDPYTVETFGYYISTLADSFSTVLYELPKREAPSEGEDAWASDASRPVRVFTPNRATKKDMPLDVRYLMQPADPGDDKRYDIVPWDVGTEYSAEELVRHAGVVYECDRTDTGTEPGTETGENPVWEEIGEIVEIRNYILEEPASGPHAGDSGTSEEREAQAVLDIANYNYLVVIENLDDEGDGRDFSFGLTIGIPELL